MCDKTDTTTRTEYYSKSDVNKWRKRDHRQVGGVGGGGRDLTDD